MSKSLQPVILEQHLHNILAVFHSGTAEQHARGRAWYDVAHGVAVEFAGRYGVTVSQAAGVISAQSPQTPWTINIKRAGAVLAAWADCGDVHAARYPGTGGACGTDERRTKCGLILASDSDTDETVTGILNGSKTVAFYRNIMLDSEPVTVDGHAVNVARFGLDRHAITEKGFSLTDKRYRDISAAYTRAADMVGVEPSTMQAITWVIHTDRPVSRKGGK